MTPEEACEYLGISLDEDLTVDLLERKYKAKLYECGESREKRARVNAACEVLVDLLAESEPIDDEEPEENSGHQRSAEKHEGLFMKLAVLMAGVFLLSFGGVMYFVYRLHTDSVQPPKIEGIPYQQYHDLLQRFRELSNDRQTSQQTPPPVVTPPADYAGLVEQVMPSMVFIQNSKGTFGSGFFVSAEGDILTNHHVIDGAGALTVTLQDGRSINALVKDYDSVRDMALLKVSLQKSVPFLKISNTLPRQGEAVIAIGNPRGYEGSVSNGIVAGIRDFDNNKWVQFTAPVSPGSSGGALVNLQGEIIGMPSLIRVDAGSQNLNFAVAPTVLNQFLSSAVNKPARSFSQLKKPKPVPRQQHPKSPQIQQSPNGKNSIPGAEFVRKDDEYEMYLYTDKIDYDRETQNAAFITLWLPTEKAKAKMRADPYFDVPYGTDLGICVLLYAANFRDNKYLHLRTINFCIDGTVARDYIKPDNEYVWRTPKKGSRPDILMKAVKRHLHIR
ncbi:MAG: serine protease [Synergistaceae bacterium]|nr:serine protease [Synergistaceae bacterium]